MRTIDASVLIAALGLWTLIAPFMCVPFIPNGLHPRFLHPTSITTEMVEIRLHIAKSKVVDSNPSIDDFSDGVKSICVATFHSGIEAAENKEVAMDQLVDEGRESEAAVIGRIRKNWL
jgi:hypothetical protein